MLICTEDGPGSAVQGWVGDRALCLMAELKASSHARCRAGGLLCKGKAALRSLQRAFEGSYEVWWSRVAKPRTRLYHFQLLSFHGCWYLQGSTWPLIPRAGELGAAPSAPLSPAQHSRAQVTTRGAPRFSTLLKIPFLEPSAALGCRAGAAH